MPQYYDNDEYDFESNASDDRPGCYPKPYCPPPCPPQQPTQVAGAQTAPAQSPLLCVPVGAANNMVAGISTQPGMVAGAQTPYGGAPFYPPYPYYGGFGYGIGWIWAVVVIVVILLIICGLWWWFGGWR